MSSHSNSNLQAVIAMAVVVFGGATLWTCATADVTHENADHLAHQWVNEAFPRDEAAGARITCQATDSDSNGYVSCTLNIVRNGEEQLIPIECNSYVFVNYGDTCRPARSSHNGRP